MKLFLHIGVEKTGSSFIQHIFAQNRKQLLGRGIMFPRGGKRERDMLTGNISPGNARDLTRVLLKDDWTAVRAFISSCARMATTQVNSILLSNENLVEPLSRPVVLDQFLAVCKEAGFDQVSMMLVLRDPVDHALSLYKHRAKDGRVADFEEWLLTDYHLPEYLKELLPSLRTKELNVVVRKYTANSRTLTEMFFNDWLGIEFPERWADVTVNPSLTLSELEILRIVQAKVPRLTNDLYKVLLTIPKAEKSKDTLVQAFIESAANRHLAKCESTWHLCNQLLAPSEALSLPVKRGDDGTLSREFSFSRKQIAELVRFWERSTSVGFHIRTKSSSFLNWMKEWKYRLASKV